MTYRSFYQEVHNGIYAMFDAGRNPKRLTIGTEQFAILHNMDAVIYNRERSRMIYMGLEIVLSDEPNLLRIDEKEMQAPVIVPEKVMDVQISLFD